MKRTTEILNAAFLVAALAGSLTACAGSTGYGGPGSWKEEVLLHDGGAIIVERSIVRKGRHEPYQRPAIGEQTLSFTLPATKSRVIWEDGFSEDLGSANFLPMMLEIDKDAVYLAASPMGCLSYNKWGRPNPPYVVFKYQGESWSRIPLQELPGRFETPNLIVSSPDDAVKKEGRSLITAEMVRKLNNLPVAAGSEQPQYRRILREPIKGGLTSCEKLVHYKCGWFGMRPDGTFNKDFADRMCDR